METRIKNLFADTETCGFHGLPIIMQFAVDDGPIEIWEFWKNTLENNKTFLEKVATYNIIGFNLSFDWFQIYKMYTVILGALKHHNKDTILEDIPFQTTADYEERGRDCPVVLKPESAFDLMLHARKTEFQVTMERSDIRVRRVPTSLAHQLADELTKQIIFDDILFARSPNSQRFAVSDCKNLDGKINPDFKDIVLKFKPSTALKVLAKHVLKEESILLHDESGVNKKLYPKEYGYAPYANAVARCPTPKIDKQKNRLGPWPDVIQYHIKHWSTDETARKYATDDIHYTRRLYKYFGSPTVGDIDSELAILVSLVRWRGYAVDLEGIRALREDAVSRKQRFPTSPSAAKKYLYHSLSQTEISVLENKSKIGSSTGKIILEAIATWRDHPAGQKAREVLEARFAGKEIELYDKILASGRLHADFNVIGALSTRMSGRGGVNPQGVNKQKKVRSQFPLAFGDLVLVGGDFSGFEIVLADAAYNDPVLRRDLLTCEKCRVTQVEIKNGLKKCLKCGGKKTMKIHGIFGTACWPDMTYDEIVATSGTKDDRYTKAKSGLFALIYGGMSYTLQTRLGVGQEDADKAYENFIARYKGVGRSRKKIGDRFASMKQPGGLGSRVIWHDPAEFVESLLGFRRYYTLENKVCKALFNMAENPPQRWNDIKVRVKRRDRLQTAAGAVRSALFGAAFGIQSQNVRSSMNHEIQSTGAGITKHLQNEIWKLQPVGVYKWIVQPMNVHDEVLCPTHPDYLKKVEEIVYNTVESFREKVPLIELEWGEMKDWSEK